MHESHLTYSVFKKKVNWHRISTTITQQLAAKKPLCISANCELAYLKKKKKERSKKLTLSKRFMWRHYLMDSAVSAELRPSGMCLNLL